LFFLDFNLLPWLYVAGISALVIKLGAEFNELF